MYLLVSLIFDFYVIVVSALITFLFVCGPVVLPPPPLPPQFTACNFAEDLLFPFLDSPRRSLCVHGRRLQVVRLPPCLFSLLGCLLMSFLFSPFLLRLFPFASRRCTVPFRPGVSSALPPAGSHGLRLFVAWATSPSPFAQV